MKRNLHSFMALIVSFCILILPLTGCSTAGRYTQRNPNQGTQGNTLKGRNIIGENMQGVDPNAGPKSGTLGNNTDGASGNNPTDVGTNPGTGTRFGIRTSPGTGINPGANRINRNITQPVVFDKQKADNIKSQLVKTPGLQNVSVIVSGNTALIGYSSTGTVKDKETKKNTVTTKVKQIDKSITNVLVGDSSEIAAQISNLSTDITSNKAGNDLGNRFNRLVQSLRPR